MPMVQITMVEGRSPEQKEELIFEVTQCISEKMAIPKERINVAIYDLPPSACGNAGVAVSKQMK